MKAAQHNFRRFAWLERNPARGGGSTRLASLRLAAAVLGVGAIAWYVFVMCEDVMVTGIQIALSLLRWF